MPLRCSHACFYVWRAQVNEKKGQPLGREAKTVRNTSEAVGEREVVCVVCVQRVTGQEMMGFTEPGDSGHLASYPDSAPESLSGLGPVSPWLRACLLRDEVLLNDTFLGAGLEFWLCSLPAV